MHIFNFNFLSDNNLIVKYKDRFYYSLYNYIRFIINYDLLNIIFTSFFSYMNRERERERISPAIVIHIIHIPMFVREAILHSDS